MIRCTTYQTRHPASRMLSAALLGLLLAGCAVTGPTNPGNPAANSAGIGEPLPAAVSGSPSSAIEAPDAALLASHASSELAATGLAAHDPEPDAAIWPRLRQGYGLPTVDNRRIDRHIDWFVRHPDYVTRVLNRSRPYLHLIVESVAARDMPAEIALLPIVESGFQPFAYSHGRASGIWQFIPGTGKRFGLKQNWWYDGRRDIPEATRAALDYLQLLNKLFDGNWLHAIAAYNCGERTVLRAIARNRRAGKPVDFWHLALPPETRSYVPKLLAIAAIVADPERFGLELIDIPNQPYLTAVDTGSQIDLATAASLAGMDVAQLYRLNPAFNRWATDPDGPHRLMLPIDKAEDFRRGLDNLAERDRINWQRHRIKSGESLSVIARRYHTTVDVLKKTNRLRSTKIRAGKHLLIPVAQKDASHYTFSVDARRQARQSSKRAGTRSVYTVRSGDNLWDIARAHDIGFRQLARWNSIATTDLLKPGQKLVIWSKPDKRKTATTPAYTRAALGHAATQSIHYVVRRGDSLSRISQRFNVTVAQLRRWNNLRKGRYLQPGQRLLVKVDITAQTGNT